MPPTLEYFLVCRSVSFDMETDEISLLNVLEDVDLDGAEPVFLPQIVAVASWNVSDEDTAAEFQTTLLITRPGDRKPVEIPMNLDRGRNRYRTLLVVSHLPLVRPGELLFEIRLNSAHGATHKVHVHPPGARFPAEAVRPRTPPEAT